MTLTADEIEQFVVDGVVRLPGAFPADVARQCVDELWVQLSEARDDATTWTQPVSRIAGAASPGIVAAINTDRLCGAIDQLVGVGRWQRRTGYGSFPVRFPSAIDPGDTGWHIDGSFAVGSAPPPWNYWVDRWSRQRALLVLMLYSDVTDDDAPTRVRVGSHRDVARVLATLPPDGASFVDVSQAAAAGSIGRDERTAIGSAGDAYLCHPFLLHAATWPHRGSAPRFLGQPAIPFSDVHDGYVYDRDDPSPCERAVGDLLGATAG